MKSTMYRFIIYKIAIQYTKGQSTGYVLNAVYVFGHEQPCMHFCPMESKKTSISIVSTTKDAQRVSILSTSLLKYTNTHP